MSKPVVIITGGAWHTGDYLQPLARTFQDSGYETKTIALPSAGANPPAKDFSTDVAAVRQATESSISQGKDVIVVLHSVSGICGTEALHGLGKKAGSPGVVAMVYVASHVPAKGHNFDQHLVSLGDESWAQARANFTQDGMIGLPPQFSQFMLYNDLPEKEAQHYTSLVVPQSVGIYDSPLTKDTYNELPIGYIATEQDQAYKYDYQVQNIADRGFPENRVLKINTGHCPWLTKPVEVRDFVLKIAAGV